MKPSPKRCCSRRTSIIVAPPRLPIGYVCPQGLLIEFRDLFKARFESVEIFHLPSNGGDLFGAQTDVADLSSRISDRQHRHRMPLASCTLRAALAMADDPLQERTAQDVPAVGEVAHELVPLRGGEFQVYT